MQPARDAGAPAPFPAKKAPIGALLLARGAISEKGLEAALLAQADSAARLGEILSHRGWASAQAVTAAAAEQIGAQTVAAGDLALDPALGDPRDIEIYLRRQMAPLRLDGETLVFVAADYADAQAGLAALASPPRRAEIALADPAAVARAITTAYGPGLAARAASRAPLAMSARAPATMVQRAGAAAFCAAALVALLAAPLVAAPILFFALVALNAMNAVVRVAVLTRALRPLRDPQTQAMGARGDAIVLAERRPPPKITLLIALLHEPETMPLLIDALERLDWPRELLDVKLILEADDAQTLAALEAIGPPPFCQILIAPPGLPRTKPRALNYALDFAEGEIVGVYDAEDRPAPDQLRRVADILRAAPPEVACVQARLGYYNPRENWLTRCFAIEYAIWFDVLIAGFRDLRLPLPLGGTSVFFRRAALEQVGGWDAHNVTEDADLGMRLARAGFRCEVTASTTEEEASSRPGVWLRQRSRWIKGFMITWLVHMRQPVTLARQLGLRGFVAFQALFLGAAVAYLGLPAFWLVWGLTLAGFGPSWLADLPPVAMAALIVVQMAGWAAMIVAAVFATARRGERWLWPWIPTLLFYWPLGAVAAWLALAEMVAAPSFWRKTRHGVGKLAAGERADALRRRAEAPEAAPPLRAAL